MVETLQVGWIGLCLCKGKKERTYKNLFFELQSLTFSICDLQPKIIHTKEKNYLACYLVLSKYYMEGRKVGSSAGLSAKESKGNGCYCSECDSH